MLSACKTLGACLILCAYAFALIHPLYAFWEYALNKQYISQSLCANKDRPQLNCEGRCYLAKRIVQTEERRPQERKPAAHKNGLEEESLYDCQLCNSRLYPKVAGKRLTLEQDAHPIFGPYTDIFHPPRLNSILL